MTLYFIEPEGSYTNAVKFAVNVPNLEDPTYQLATQSKYSKNLLTMELNVLETNDRYTEFGIDYTDQLGDLDISGIFQYSIYDSNDNLIFEQGTLKIVNNKTESLQNKTKYTSPNENGDSYVIY